MSIPPGQRGNALMLYRHKRHMSTEHVARLLGHKTATTINDYERGARLPSFSNALRLSVILRTPVEFLFPTLYEALRQSIRADEEHLAAPKQQALF